MGARYDVGYRTPNHIMNEFHLMLHLAGQVGYRYLDGGAETYEPGTAGVMYEGRAGWMMNAGQEPSAAIWTWVGTPGKPLSSAVAAPAPPATGNAGLVQPAAPQGAPLGPAAFAGLVGLTLVVLAFSLHRRVSRP
jgi:hypothetical protein